MYSPCGRSEVQKKISFWLGNTARSTSSILRMQAAASAKVTWGAIAFPFQNRGTEYISAYVIE